MILGGTYEIPIYEGLLQKDYVEQLKITGTYSDDSFDREYRSKWTGNAEYAFFNAEKFDKCRVLNVAENKYQKNKGTLLHGEHYYVLGVDVGRYDCTTEVMVFKVIPQATGTYLKCLVNIYTYKAEHFEQQSINIKKLYFQYKAKCIAIDGNGIGAGLVDFLTISQVDLETGEILPPLGVENDPDGKYRKMKTEDTIPNALYIIKANAPMNTEIYTYVKTQIYGHKIRLLIDEQEAKAKLMNTKLGSEMGKVARDEYLRPYMLTSVLKTQMMNLIEENEGVNIILKRDSRSIYKDKFSAFSYGLYYIKLIEDAKNRHKTRDISRLMLIN